MGAEAYVRAGIEQQRLRAHVLRLIVLLVAVMALGLAVQVIVKGL